jgi:2-dehydro-3-deoxyphosphogluconate aldolase/(4S)-4-hydroxy-2-oxoglutarate aldolase
MAPSELVTAWDAGAAAVKLFPASTVGPGHLEAVRELRVVATGGIAPEDIGAWLRAGALAGRARWALGEAAGAR